MPIEPNDILRCTTKVLSPNNNYSLNVWWFKATGTGSAAEADVSTAAEAAIESFFGTLGTRMKVGTTFPELLLDQVAWELTPAPPSWKTLQTLTLQPWGETFNPAGSGEPLPTQDAVLLRMITSLRKHQGRKYFGPFTEAENNAEGLVGAAFIQDIVTVSTNLMTAHSIPNSTMELVFVVPNMSGPATNIFNTIIVGNVWRSQRRRQIGVGI